jgi:hypothetical protein
MLPAPSRQLLRRLGVVAPPLALLPIFLGSSIFYELYPLRFSGEIVEAMMGLGFAFSALAACRHATSVPVQSVAALATVIAVLGLANSWHSQSARAASPEAIAAAHVELDALQADFLREYARPDSPLLMRCGVHKRLYTARERYQLEFLSSGNFSALIARGMPEERAEFLLDPWNTPYWIRDDCEDPRRRVIFVYSFGPNRLRDSSRREVRGDDLGRGLLGDEAAD